MYIIFSSNNPMGKVWMDLWKLKIHAKIKHFQLPISPEDVESTDHILFNCNWIRGI